MEGSFSTPPGRREAVFPPISEEHVPFSGKKAAPLDAKGHPSLGVPGIDQDSSTKEDVDRTIPGFSVHGVRPRFEVLAGLDDGEMPIELSVPSKAKEQPVEKERRLAEAREAALKREKIARLLEDMENPVFLSNEIGSQKSGNDQEGPAA